MLGKKSRWTPIWAIMESGRHLSVSTIKRISSPVAARCNLTPTQVGAQSRQAMVAEPAVCIHDVSRSHTMESGALVSGSSVDS